jgi:hypothetical protein
MIKSKKTCKKHLLYHKLLVNLRSEIVLKRK